MPVLSIIIPTRDRGDILFKTLERVIESSAHIDVEILVINNSVSPVILQNKPPQVSLFDSPVKNNGSSCRNYGASLAKSPILLFVDDDILVSKEAIDYAISFQHQNKNSCCSVNWQYPASLIDKIKKTIFGTYLITHGFTSLKALYNTPISKPEWSNDEPFISASLASFFFCIKKEDFIKIGGYYEKHLYEGTDVDISTSLNKNNITIWINPAIMVYHNEADRVDIVNWMERKKRLGTISRNAVILGDESQRLTYSFVKRIVYEIIYALQPIFLFNIKLLDRLKIKWGGNTIVDILLGANICHGYYSIGK